LIMRREHKDFCAEIARRKDRIIENNRKRKRAIVSAISLMVCAFIVMGGYFSLGRFPETGSPEVLGTGEDETISNGNIEDNQTDIIFEENSDSQDRPNEDRVFFLSVELPSDSDVLPSENEDGKIRIESLEKIEELLVFISDHENEFIYSMNNGNWNYNAEMGTEERCPETDIHTEVISGEESTQKNSDINFESVTTFFSTDEMTEIEWDTEGVPEGTGEIIFTDVVSEKKSEDIESKPNSLKDFVKDIDNVYIITVIDDSGNVYKYALDALRRNELAEQLKDLLSQ